MKGRAQSLWVMSGYGKGTCLNLFIAVTKSQKQKVG
jgi:hypothetical protein